MLKNLETRWLTHFLPEYGLPQAKESLRDLGQVVVLAGPNGSGKSRFLRALRSLLAEVKNVRPMAEQGWTAQKLMENLETREKPSGWNESHRIPDLRRIAALEILESYGLERPLNVYDLTQPENITVRDAGATSSSELSNCVAGCVAPGLAGAYEHQHVFLDLMARRLAMKSHRSEHLHKSEIEIAERFSQILFSLLGTSLASHISSSLLPEATIFDRPFSSIELSSGQKVLVAWTVALHAQKELKDSIVLIDEPENHLHPDACINALEKLQNEVLGPTGQIWIATHSIPIIAWSGAKSLYSVQNGLVSYASNKVESVINTLSGGRDKRENLRDFLTGADQFGFYHFVAQCLTAPGVVESNDGDPQEKVFAQLVSQFREKDGKLRILDFGSGQGRLADAIARESTNLNWLSYFLFDPDPRHRDERLNALNRLKHLGAQGDVYDELGTLRVKGNQVHLVVLCNVLHEIPPSDWIRVFADIKSLLLPQGQLVIIEDQEPSVGELPHNKGFFLLNKNELSQLFGGNSANVEDKSPGSRVVGGRISVLCVPHRSLQKANAKSRKAALKDLYERARSEVQKIRGSESVAQRDGRRHALYVMLAFNAFLAMDD